MAAKTSNGTGGGNASAGASWSGGVAPADGDTITVVSGDTITQDVNRTYGSKAGSVGHAVTINGASSSSFGTFVVNNGITLTLRGVDLTTNTLMLINQFGQFNPAAGSTIVGDTAADYGSIILNKGQINAVGSSGSHITFTSPSGNVNWATSVASEALTLSNNYYVCPSNILCISFANHWIANSGGTGLGVQGNTSVSFSAQNPGTILATEVASLAAVNGTGKYWIDYDMGILYAYGAAGTATATTAYKYLSLTNTWGIQSLQNTSYNSAVFQYCDFTYMGSYTASLEKFAIMVANKKSDNLNASVNPSENAGSRLFKMTNCTASYCSLFLELQSNILGNSTENIQITNNTFNTVHGNPVYGSCIGSNLPNASNPNSYINISNNTLNTRQPFYTSYGNTTASSQIQNQSITFTGNTGRSPSFLNGSAPAVVHPDCLVQSNTITGVGWAFDSRWVQGMGGTSGHRFVAKNNATDHVKRYIHWESYLLSDSDQVIHTYHHGFPGTINDDTYITDVNLINCSDSGNFATTLSASPFVELGYNHRIHVDSVTIANNTTANHPQGVLGFGDCQDNGVDSLITNAIIENNIAENQSAGSTSGGVQGILRRADSTNALVRVHCLTLDYGLYHNVTNQYGGISKGGIFTLGGSNYNKLGGGSRNLVGLALQFPTYASPTTGLSVAYAVVSSGINETLTLTDGTGAGSAVQIVHSHGTCTSASSNGTNKGYAVNSTITDSGQTWSTVRNNSGCPRCRWFKVTGGTGSGQIRGITNNTATTLTVVPVLTTALDATSTYTVYESEVTLTGGSGSTLNAGIDARVFPFGSNTSDSSISYALHDVGNVSAQMVNSNSTTVTDFKLQAGSPAIDAGLSTDAPSTDYFGTSRPQGSAIDIGFYEAPVTGGPWIYGDQLDDNGQG